ncbi:MAG: hypothetical protein COZ46_00395 [Verrucomicrobia bacterium CG_4_10_14_3_um_filter_43_23]|nr:MAG: hypothetical protein AUJ82_04545 [Verrucomicrobia bacterium CG1_02_43_26]PIP59036.1 MAG: hypothetical protein COX01_05665 [Verrucomicrobia bacterium CG22_combo_CG10-13_8_21_14_all_43_17]PIX59133.1 MAG: hypothetical protein COZ46_00395 [Verrucomicrobia bacterium CG_4_10_14_3_um_filter_43_23]PIY61345.1 MAG: hypothetical protein COY94_05715 [Verrucomicrobia bacterium CG_4_10_14_0_8_um_filter_43_34]PJA44126.1 MAG: hypothetical protein CO175_04430 [Verrucomicrobia bacterium CG_4_9_14_3_um_fi
MSAFFHLFFHEIKMLGISVSTYIAGVLFLALMGFLYLMILESYASAPQDNFPSTEFFRIFWLPVFFMVPLLTMKSIADERRTGTLETLKTTPINAWSIVLSKFLAAYFFYMALWAITLSFPIITQLAVPYFKAENRLFDLASLIGGYSFIALSGFLYISLGILASSLTRSQLVAGMLSFSFLFLLMVGGKLFLDLPFLDLSLIPYLPEAVNYLQTFQHLEDFSRGVIDSRPIFFYLVNGLFALGVTSIIIEDKL